MLTLNPTLAEEWHPTKNGVLTPSTVLSGSSLKVWWKCQRGHEWQASVVNRHKHGSSCPYCARLLPISGETDLEANYPEVANEWHPTKNGTLMPYDVLPGSDKVVWWLCKHGHEWQAPVKRCLKGQGCPYCSGRRPIKGKNDIASQNLFLASEWNEKRNGLPASNVSIRSGKKYWWKCSKCGFEWQATPHNRANGSLSTGCPECAKETQTSYPEQVIFYYISKHYPDAINRFSGDFLGKMELDIFIPSLKIGIEYDGVVWHSNNETIKREKAKYLTCQEHGVYLIRVREESYENEDRNYDHIIYANRHPTNTILQQILKLISEIVPMEDEFLIDDDEQDIRFKYIARSKRIH